jgi:predicted cupin superfamily sugar epimerase
MLEGQRLMTEQTVVPGFEYEDHDFLTIERFEGLVTEEQRAEMEWLVRRK